MLSKWYPWDFFKNNPKVVDTRTPGYFAIEVFDPYLERMITFNLRNSYNGIQYISGPEVTPDWLSQQFQELDLFSFNPDTSSSNPTTWLILNPDEIPKQTRVLILENSISLDQNNLIFSFTKKSSFFDELSKCDFINCLKMDEPRFWETSKYLNFLEIQMGMNLDSVVHQYILDAVANDTQSFIEALSKLRRFNTTWSGLPKSLDQVKAIVHKSRLDQFSLASLFCKKKKVNFYKQLIDVEADFDSFRMLFSFMQGHLMKLIDPSYMSKKTRMSKYDKEIDAHSKLWRKSELEKEISLFSNFEILAKQKSEQLKFELRAQYLEEL